MTCLMSIAPTWDTWNGFQKVEGCYWIRDHFVRHYIVLIHKDGCGVRQNAGCSEWEPNFENTT